MLTPSQRKASHIYLKRMVKAQLEMWNASGRMEKALKQEYTNVDELVKEICVSYDDPEQVTLEDTEEFLKRLIPDGPACSS